MTTRKISTVLILIGMLSSFCTSNRQVAKIEPSNSAINAEEESSKENSKNPENLYPFGVREETEALELILKDAELLYQKGKENHDNRNYERAEIFFDECLDLLENCGFDFEDHPRIDHAYYTYLSDIRRLEIQSIFNNQEEPEFPLLDELGTTESPLDFIANVNLYEIEIDPGLENLVSEDLRRTQYDIPIVVNKQVLKFLDYYQGRGRKATEESLKRSGRYIDLFKSIFREHDLPLDLIYLANVESLFKPSAYSRARARGIWQFMKGTGRLYGLEIDWWLDERLDFVKSTETAARYLKDLHDEFGDWYLALAAYNGGPGRVRRALNRYGDLDYWTMTQRRMLPRETRNFVPSILASILIFRNPEHYGFHIEPDNPLEYEFVNLDYQVDLDVIAESIGMDFEAIRTLNPELMRGVTPFETSDYRLKVPLGKSQLLLTKLAALPPEKRLRLKHHKVRQGETLSVIASRYGTSIRAIADVNRIRNIHRLKLGQDLIIPLSDWKAAALSSQGKGDPSIGRHTVRRGDSMYQIARYYGVSLQNLYQWNNLGPKDIIHPGQEILLQPGSHSND
jgi:membrane-bound lytic murein transglycosylase D